MTNDQTGSVGLVSVIVPVYNRPSMLRECVQSVLDQSYRPIEVIIVDDGSTDATAEVADALGQANPEIVRVLHQDNGGPGMAREAGRRIAHGEFIQYLDSDDLLLPGKFEMQVNGLNEHRECGASYGWTQYEESGGRIGPAPWKGSGVRVVTMFPSFLKERWWDTPTPLYRSCLLALAGPWSDLRLEEDWEYDTRVAALGVRLHFCEAFVARVRDHGDHRLCRGESLDPLRLKERARAHAMIYENAIRGGVKVDSQEMQHFARELFLLSRQCGSAGLANESHRLFRLAREASGPERGVGVDFVLYEAAASLVGWASMGRIACLLDRLRP